MDTVLIANYQYTMPASQSVFRKLEYANSERHQSAGKNMDTTQMIAASQTTPNAMAAKVPAGVFTRSPERRCCHASRLHRAATSGGIILIATAISTGRMSRSSSCPKKGMKSGIRSIGLTAYATATIMTTRARTGVRGSFHARNKAHTCRFILAARRLSLAYQGGTVEAFTDGR